MKQLESFLMCNEKVEVKPILPDEGTSNPAIIIVPGGSYRYCSPIEHITVAQEFAKRGYACFALLKYAVCRDSAFPTPLQNLGEVVAHVRKNHLHYGINTDKIAVMGFSAGGHMCALLGNHWHEDKYFKSLGLTAEDVKPNAQILAYPFLNFRGGNNAIKRGGEEIIKALPPALADIIKPETDPNLVAKRGLPAVLGINKDKWKLFFDTISSSPLADALPIGIILLQDVPEVEITNFVNSMTPPTFLWHSTKDDVVPATQSAEMAIELDKHGVEYALHLFSTGRHAIGVDSVSEEVDAWPQMVDFWLKKVL